MNKLSRAFAMLAIGLFGSLWLALPAGAQSWPPKTIRIIIPFPPGGTTDLIARRAQPMTRLFVAVTGGRSSQANHVRRGLLLHHCYRRG